MYHPFTYLKFPSTHKQCCLQIFMLKVLFPYNGLFVDFTRLIYFNPSIFNAEFVNEIKMTTQRLISAIPLCVFELSINEYKRHWGGFILENPAASQLIGCWCCKSSLFEMMLPSKLNLWPTSKGKYTEFKYVSLNIP